MEEVIKAGTFLLNNDHTKLALIYRERGKDWSFPKGHLEKNETIEECAIRETNEETKRNCKIICESPYVYRYANSIGEKCICYMYLAEDLGKSDNTSTDTHFTKWFNLEEVENKLTYINLKEVWKEAKVKYNLMSKC